MYFPINKISSVKYLKKFLGRGCLEGGQEGQEGRERREGREGQQRSRVSPFSVVSVVSVVFVVSPCGEGGALADACIKTDAPRSTVAIGYPLATNQRNKSKAQFFRQKGLDTTLGEFLGDGLYYGTAHCQDNSLAAVDDPLSRKKNDPQMRVVLVGLPGFELHYQW